MGTIEKLLNRKPEGLQQVSIWLGSRKNWDSPRRRFVGLLRQSEIDFAMKSFIADPKSDSCWGDRAFTMYPERFDPR